MLIGIQGSGKWTQARKILEKYPEYVLFEMGSELRKFIQTDSELAQAAKKNMHQWLKVPIEAVIEMTKRFLEKHTDKHIILDGVIRSKEQNDELEWLFGDFEVLWLDLNEETAVERLSGRRIDPVTNETFPASFTGDTNPKTGNTLVTRADDTPEAIRKRIAWSKWDTLPLIEVWKRHGHTIHHIDASQSEEDIFHYVENAINK